MTELDLLACKCTMCREKRVNRENRPQTVEAIGREVRNASLPRISEYAPPLARGSGLAYFRGNSSCQTLPATRRRIMETKRS